MHEAAIVAQNRAFVEAVAAGRPTEPTAQGVLPVYRALQWVEDSLRRSG
jgi:hypothetical protein